MGKIYLMDAVYSQVLSSISYVNTPEIMIIEPRGNNQSNDPGM